MTASLARRCLVDNNNVTYIPLTIMSCCDHKVGKRTADVINWSFVLEIPPVRR